MSMTVPGWNDAYYQPPDPAPECECNECTCEWADECHDDRDCGCCLCNDRNCHDCWSD